MKECFECGVPCESILCDRCDKLNDQLEDNKQEE